MEPRGRASAEQFVIILEFMEKNGDIARPQPGAQGRIRADGMWNELVQMLNSVGGGVYKDTDKWKKVWSDWKTKTKKKALQIRRHANGTGGGPSSRLSLSRLEERVLAIMGLLALAGQAEIVERGINSLECISKITGPNLMKFKCGHTGSTSFQIKNLRIGSPYRELPHKIPNDQSMGYPSNVEEASAVEAGETAHVQFADTSSPTPSPPPQLEAESLSILATAPSEHSRRREPPTTTSTHQPLPQDSMDAPGPLRRRRRAQTPFDRAASEFAAVELRRLQIEELREHNLHEREMDRLRVESSRLELAAGTNRILQLLGDIAQKILDRMP